MTSTDLSHLREHSPLRIGKGAYKPSLPCGMARCVAELRKDRWAVIGSRLSDVPPGYLLEWEYVGKFAETTENGRVGPELRRFHDMIEDGRAITVHRKNSDGDWVCLAKLAVKPVPMRRTWRIYKTVGNPERLTQGERRTRKLEVVG